MKKEYYIQGDPAIAEEIKAAFEEKGCTLYRLASKCDSEDLIYYSLNGIVRGIKKDNLYLFEAHPGYKKLELPIQPNFKVGDWITDGTCKVKITDIDNTHYWFSKNCILGKIESIDKKFHLWTINDAKDGDVLATNAIICIFKKLDKDGYYIISPCTYTVKGGLEVIEDEDDSIGSCGFKPATKEDRELLFRKMKEAGYTWDEKKKVLKKVSKHYDISNFHAGMPVLVRDSDNSQWSYVQFSHYCKSGICHFNAVGLYWKQCIPFKGNEHLLGTNDPCGEEFINW